MEPSGGEQEPGAVRLLDLPWEDVLLPHILSRVPLRQLLHLQRVSRAFQALVQLHLARLRSFDSAQVTPPSRGGRGGPGGGRGAGAGGRGGARRGAPGVSPPAPPQVGPQVPRAALARLLRDAEGLQELCLESCRDWLSDEDLEPVLGRNPGLRRVGLAGCGRLSRRALVTLSVSCAQLRCLSLAHCDWVDGLALQSLADRCPCLEALDLTACRQLRDRAVAYLAQRRGARLRSLSLAVNANVGDATVQELARCCPQLEHLDLTGCLRVRSDAIRTLAEYCPRLRSLRVRHCHDVAESSLSVLRKRGVNIDVEPPLQRALVLLQDVVGFTPFVNLQI
ncbi:F-box/LRR-repeat protein 15 isoform X1 [Macrotis lagotis]|uniref:F-box/LRR-repeat protein 15 isoform X1 n=1 Tax=Macrotis lagotis TaxID=92651 RepID=UPI003D6857CF